MAWQKPLNGIKMEKSKIKICHIANHDGAVKFLLLPQLEFLISQGYDVSVICSLGRWANEIQKRGIKIKNIKIKRQISPFFDAITLFKLWNYIRKEKFDIVHTHNPKPGLLGQLAAKFSRVPIIINTVHGLYSKNRFFIFIEKIAALCSDLIFSQNKEDIETIIKEKISIPQKIRYLGNGIDIEKFNIKRFSYEFIKSKKEQLGIRQDVKIVGIVARLVVEKGYLDLFEAFRSVVKIFPDTILLIVGPKEPEKKDGINLEITKKYGIENNIKFLGERGDVDEILPLMDVLVLPSYREGMPRSILEAMAESRPIVATDIRGCREEIENGKSGILVPPKNPEKLAEKIIYFLSNKDYAQKLGNVARERVESNFDEKIIFEKINEEYKNLIKEKMQKNRKIYFICKRIFDFLLSLFLLILFFPIILIIVLLIKLDSFGPVFYKGERIGRYGKPFKIYKFRTMVPNAEKIGTIHAARNDPRITKIGRFLRTYKLDELPQLINILKGQMSFVGPRPQVKHYVDLYNDYEKESLKVPPGMTDYATIKFINLEDLVDEKNVDESYRKNIEPIKNKLRVDYAKNASFFTDIAIIFQTFEAIFRKNILNK